MQDSLAELAVCPQKEGVHEVRPLISLDQLDESLKQTLLCFVLVAPNAAHSFCSRYDFGPWPLLPGVTSMPPSAWQVTFHFMYIASHKHDWSQPNVVALLVMWQHDLVTHGCSNFQH